MLEQAAKAEELRKKEQKSKKLGVVNLTLVSFAVTRKAYERITQRFAREYEAAKQALAAKTALTRGAPLAFAAE